MRKVIAAIHVNHEMEKSSKTIRFAS